MTAWRRPSALTFSTTSHGETKLSSSTCAATAVVPNHKVSRPAASTSRRRTACRPCHQPLARKQPRPNSTGKGNKADHASGRYHNTTAENATTANRTSASHSRDGRRFRPNGGCWCDMGSEFVCGHVGDVAFHAIDHRGVDFHIKPFPERFQAQILGPQAFVFVP